MNTPARRVAGAGSTIVGAPLMVMVSCSVAESAVGVPESVTLKVRLAVPAQEATGVPERTPAAVSVRQLGSVPLLRVHV